VLTTLREKKNSPIIAVFLGLIILTFIFLFGQSGSSGAATRDWAAKINGETVTDRDFSQRYATVYRSYQQQYGQFDRKAAESMDLRRKVLDQMIQTTLLGQVARERGLAVDDEALKLSILGDDNFKVEGRFDKQQYERVLNSNGIAPAEYENYRRQLLLAEKLASVVQGSTYVSDAEIKQMFETEKTSIDVEFVKIAPAAVGATAPLPSADDAKAWLTATADSEEQVTKYYTKHKRAKYDVPKKLRARHVLIRSEKGLPPDMRQQNLEKLKKIEADIKSGKLTIEQAATQFSEDSTKEKGGDLGFFSAGQMVGPFEEAVFALKVGETSGIVETPFGFHIIKLEEIQEPIVKKLEDVKVEIAQELLREEKGTKVAEEKAKTLDAALRSGKTLAELVPENNAEGLKVDSTGSFGPGRDYVPKLGVDKALSQALWKLTTASPYLAGPMKIEGAWVVARLKARETPSMSELDAAKAELRPRLLFEKRTQVMEQWSAALKKTARIETNPLVLSYDDSGRPQGQTGFDGM